MILPAWSAVTIAVLSEVATAPKRPSASRSAFVSLQAGDDAPELAADMRGDVEQARVRHDRLEREALDDGEDLVVDRHRERERAAQPAGGGRLGAREVGVLGDIGDPGRAARGRDAAREPDARRRTPSARSASGRPHSASGARSAPGAGRAPRPRRRGRPARRASRSSGRRARRRRASPRRWSPPCSSPRRRSRSGRRSPSRSREGWRDPAYTLLIVESSSDLRRRQVS